METNHTGPPPEGPGGGGRSEPPARGKRQLPPDSQTAPVSVWIGTLGCIDIWGELDVHHGERELNESSPYRSVTVFGETLIRHSAENIYNVLPWWSQYTTTYTDGMGPSRPSLSSASCVFDKANPWTFQAGKDQRSCSVTALFSPP